MYNKNSTQLCRCVEQISNCAVRALCVRSKSPGDHMSRVNIKAIILVCLQWAIVSRRPVTIVAFAQKSSRGETIRHVIIVTTGTKINEYNRVYSVGTIVYVYE